jgi:hypothetical protein
MKTKILAFSLIVFFVSTLGAQDMGSLLGQVVNGVKSSAFSNGKSGKSDIISQLNNVKGGDYLGYASVAGSLAGSLKDAAFLPDWATQKGGVLERLQEAGSMADVAGGLLGVVGNLNPKSLTKDFKKNKPLIKSGLEIMSKMK